MLTWGYPVHQAKSNKHACRGRLKGREGSPEDFLHPARRVTDCLILANIGFYIAQVLTRGRIMVWGMKVSCLTSIPLLLNLTLEA